MEEVWITGAGCLCAAGLNLEQSFVALKTGRVPAPAPPARLLALVPEAQRAGLKHPAFSLPEACFPGGFRHSALDGLALEETAAREALEQAGLSPQGLSGSHCGVVVGATAGNALHFLDDYARLREGRETEGQGVKDFFKGNPAQALAGQWNLTGPVLTVGNACCSGTDAIGLGGELIRSGRCQKVLAGGADALSLVPYIGFKRLMIYSDQPCRPFDRHRRGLNLGEGAGLLFMETPQSARARGARPLARLLSYAAASDAHHLTAPHPEALGLRRAIRKALSRAGLKPHDLAFVNAHGTATRENDRAEALAFSAELPQVPVWASKGSTGHTLGAAGAIEAALTAAALAKDLLPPSWGYREVDPELKLAPSGPLDHFEKEAAMSVSLGFGGGNSVLIFRRVKR